MPETFSFVFLLNIESPFNVCYAGMGHGDKYEDDSLDVFHYFNSSCYKGFGDDKEVRGFL